VGDPEFTSPFLPSNYRELPDDQLLEVLAFLQLQKYHLGLKPRPWRLTARNKQLDPSDPKHHQPAEGEIPCGCTSIDDEWTIFLLMAGRGFGKTQAGSNWLVEQALRPENAGRWFAAVGTTFNEVDRNMMNGPSGIRKQLLPGEEASYNINNLRLTLCNGSIIQGYSVDIDQKVRGANLAGVWVDELASIRYPEYFYEALVPALRIGEKPRMFITTTPRPTEIIKDLVKRGDGSVHVTCGPTWENAHLSENAKAELRRRYEGTRIGRQELEGLLLDDLEGALFKRSDLEENRIRRDDLPELERIVVGIDPAMTSHEGSDESGIVVVGEADGHAFVLDDKTLRGSPDEVMRTASWAYEEWQADCCVIEANQGGDWITNTLHSVNPNIRIKTVHARRGKILRAEPVAALNEQGRFHLVGVFAELEDELCCLIPGEKPQRSPGRADAAVWAMYELRGISQGSYYSDAYGFKDCDACKRTIKKADARCRFCGKEFPPGTAPIEESKRGMGKNWKVAYSITCPKGHEYPKGRDHCPQCYQTPNEFLNQVAKLTGQNPGAARAGSLGGIWKRGGYR
jgi:phage terminase large subunit-like protein